MTPKKKLKVFALIADIKQRTATKLSMNRIYFLRHANMNVTAISDKEVSNEKISYCDDFAFHSDRLCH